jgi:hypothetical protein
MPDHLSQEYLIPQNEPESDDTRKGRSAVYPYKHSHLNFFLTLPK